MTLIQLFFGCNPNRIYSAIASAGCSQKMDKNEIMKSRNCTFSLYSCIKLLSYFYLPATLCHFPSAIYPPPSNLKIK